MVPGENKKESLPNKNKSFKYHQKCAYIYSLCILYIVIDTGSVNGSGLHADSASIETLTREAV